MSIDDIAKAQWEWVEKMGWHNKTPLECLAIIASELGKAINEFRGLEPTGKLPEELAEIVLRVVDFAYDRGISLEVEIERKMKIRSDRFAMGRGK
jgi:NTP pyrophosphatase (non-canonical NTP hydrolase)